MATDFVRRTEREREQYDHGLQRSGYDRLFRHCGSQYRVQRERLLRAEMQIAADGDVLEIGCRMWCPWLEALGIEPRRLTCINISERELDAGRALARQSCLAPRFEIMDAHRLQYPDQSFDLIFGGGVLHHLELDAALPEIARVLRPGGRIVFHEPLDFNPIGRLVRRLTPAARTRDEKPFRRRDVATMRQWFLCRFHFEQLVSVPLGVLSGLVSHDGDNWLMRSAMRCDQAVLRVVPGVGWYFRHVLIVGSHRADPA